MEIEDKRPWDRRPISEIKPGQCFTFTYENDYKEVYAMKLVPSEAINSIFAWVDLRTGELDGVQFDMKVIPLDGKMVIGE